MTIYYFSIPFLFFAANAFSWICPGNFNQIGVGDTIDKVMEQCGKPESEKKSLKKAKGPEEWRYFVAFNQPYQSTYSPTTTPAPTEATVKMTVTFVQGKAINITVQDQSLSSTSICGPTISTGDTDESIKKSCGKPLFIQKQLEDDQEKPTEEVILKYNNAPPNTLIFENGILKERK